MRKLILLIFMCFILSGVVFATDWNVDLGDWDVDANWTAGKPDGTNGYINLTRADAVCNLNTDEGLIPARWVQQNGNVLNILDGGRFGAQWSRVGRGSAAFVNMSGNGTFVMNNDDLYIGLESGTCVWTMADNSSLYVEPATAGGDELYIGEDGGTGTLKLIGSNVTVNVDRVHVTANNPTGTATLEYVMDASGASTIVADRSYIGEAGNAHLILSATADMAEEDIVLIEATGTYDIGGTGVFNTLNGGPAPEGTPIIVGGNVYHLTYTYDAGADAEKNDVALVFVKSAKYMASNPIPANNSSVESSPLTLSWANPDPNDDISPITCTVHFGIAPPDPNRTNMDHKTLSPDVSSVDINTENFPIYGVQPLADANDFYWVVDCFDPSADPGAGQGLYWKFSTDYNKAPTVYAGPDQVAWLGMSGTPGEEVVYLDGTTSDDGQPGPEYDVLWTQTGGPEIDITPANQDDTSVTINEAGIYEFMLSADDGEKQADDTVQIIVGENACDASYLNGSDYNVTDLNEDCVVNIDDFATLAADWLECTDTLTNCSND